MQPEPATPMSIAVGLFATAVIVAGGACWALSIARLSFGQPLVPWSPRRPAPWGLVDLVLVVILYLLIQVALFLALKLLGVLGQDAEELTLFQRQALTASGIGSSLLTVVIGFGFATLRSGANASDLGLRARKAGHDSLIGLAAFAMLAPPVFALQGLLVYFWKPSKHPLIELFKGTPDPVYFLLLVIAAVVVAPLVEELLFRVLLQGFLEKLATFRGDFNQLLLGTADPPAASALATHGEAAPAPPQPPPSGLESGNPYQPPGIEWSQSDSESSAIDAIECSADQPELRGWRAFAPIAISSIIFALLHYNHGPDWVPLTLLAMGMGYVYQRTHSLLPSLIVHVLLNGFSMWIFWIQVFQRPN